MKEKKQISIFLMVVGVVFIVIAGGIFVTTAWKYLPESGKRMLLFGSMVGLFTASVKVSGNPKLKRTERLLFYLGVVFTGFFTLSVMTGLFGQDTLFFPINAFYMLMADLAMLVPVLIRLMVCKKGFEFSMAAIIMDGAVICTELMLELETGPFLLMSGVYVLFLAAVDYYEKTKETGQEGLRCSIRCIYLIHEMIYFFLALQGAIVLWENLEQYWMAAIITVFICVNLIVVFYMHHKELFYIQFSFGILVPFIQLFVYQMSIYVRNIFGKTDSTWNTVYFPFSFAMMAVLWCVSLREKKVQGNMEKALKMAAGLQAFSGILMWMASQNAQTHMMIFYLLSVISIVTVSLFIENQTAKSILWSIALPAGIMGVYSQPFFDIQREYIVEWNCFLFGIGVVLLGFVWYDKKEDIRKVQFVSTCCLLAVLLLRNLLGENAGLINVLILGAVGAIILLVAAITNHKEYVIASSVTLVLLVLYVTRDFWLSIEWWVYLFAAGVILILVAIKQEKDS
ncbi:MAG: hypothetical protein K2J90_13710 [Lachnospiraceae bacterium]|nr:hypothetical protein [Lachnospiraceae bacterium]